MNNGVKYIIIISILLIVVLLLKKFKPNVLTVNVKPIKKPYKNMILETWDKASQPRIDTLHPLFKADVIKFINDAESQGYKIRVTEGFRSIEQQNKDYAQGRTEGVKGKTITKAVGGNSFHNYRLAIDVVEIKDGKALFINPNWAKIGAIGRNYGFVWGGDWTLEKEGIIDKPHFQKSYGKTLAQIKDLAKFSKDGIINLT